MISILIIEKLLKDNSNDKGNRYKLPKKIARYKKMQEYTVHIGLWLGYSIAEYFNDLEKAKAFAEKEAKTLGVQEIIILDENDNIVAKY